MGKRGRPTLLTEERSNKILKDVGAGAYISTACIAAGIKRQTFYNWMEQGEKGKQPFAQFFDALKKAEAEAEIEAMRKMRKGGKHFLPEATFLERRYRDKWGRSDRLAAATSPENAPIHVSIVLYRPNGKHQEIELNPITSSPKPIELAAPAQAQDDKPSDS